MARRKKRRYSPPKRVVKARMIREGEDLGVQEVNGKPRRVVEIAPQYSSRCSSKRKPKNRIVRGGQPGTGRRSR